MHEGQYKLSALNQSMAGLGQEEGEGRNRKRGMMMMMIMILGHRQEVLLEVLLWQGCGHHTQCARRQGEGVCSATTSATNSRMPSMCEAAWATATRSALPASVTTACCVTRETMAVAGEKVTADGTVGPPPDWASPPPVGNCSAALKRSSCAPDPSAVSEDWTRGALCYPHCPSSHPRKIGCNLCGVSLRVCRRQRAAGA